MTPALAFPAAPTAAWLDTPGLDESGLALRPATDEDLPFLRDLYAESRATELAAMPWPAQAKRAFCESQFVLQHRHYVAHYVPAAFLIVLHRGEAVGRLYLHAAAREMRIIDVLLAAAARGRGIGSALLRWVQAAAVRSGAEALSLHVMQTNRGAFELYRRLGFLECGAEDGHLRMAWRPPVSDGQLS